MYIKNEDIFINKQFINSYIQTEAVATKRLFEENQLITSMHKDDVTPLTIDEPVPTPSDLKGQETQNTFI